MLDKTRLAIAAGDKVTFRFVRRPRYCRNSFGTAIARDWNKKENEPQTTGLEDLGRRLRLIFGYGETLCEGNL